MDDFANSGPKGAKALDPKNQRIFDLMARVRSTYFKTKNDDELLVKLRRIERGIQDGREPGHALIVMGESGAGKSTIVEKALKSLATLKDYDDGYGNEMRPILYVIAPPSCTMTDLAAEILERLGYESASIGRGASVYHKLQRSLKNYGVRLLVIDEFQHVLEAPKIKGPAYVTNTMKNMLQDKSWPVHLVLVGLPEIEAVVDRDPAEQMERRTDPLTLANLSFKEDGEYVEWIVNTLVEDRAGLRMSSDQPHEFVERLMHGARSRFGLIMHLITYAIEDALEAGHDEVSTENWIEAYARLAKSKGTDDNVFAEPAWRSIIRPVNRDGSLGPVAPIKSPKKGRK
ncbi:TniB family NTP-binding protein [Sinorhizobium saheli]|nr:TniB family NTP-binding protein [Sinorhizobium saheli]